MSLSPIARWYSRSEWENSSNAASKPATTKGNTEGQLRLALCVCTEPICRKVRLTPLSSLQLSGTLQPTRPHSEIPTCTSSSQDGSEVCSPKASTSDCPIAFRILLTTISTVSTRLGSHAAKTGWSFSVGLHATPAMAIRSSRSPTLSGRSNNRSAAGTMLHSMS